MWLGTLLTGDPDGKVVLAGETGRQAVISKCKAIAAFEFSGRKVIFY
jgi:hypothetical protein